MDLLKPGLGFPSSIRILSRSFVSFRVQNFIIARLKAALRAALRRAEKGPSLGAAAAPISPFQGEKTIGATHGVPYKTPAVLELSSMVLATGGHISFHITPAAGLYAAREYFDEA